MFADDKRKRSTRACGERPRQHRQNRESLRLFGLGSFQCERRERRPENVAGRALRRRRGGAQYRVARSDHTAKPSVTGRFGSFTPSVGLCLTSSASDRPAQQATHGAEEMAGLRWRRRPSFTPGNDRRRLESRFRGAAHDLVNPLHQQPSPL